ncbi:MAG: DUF2878 domain-containing protein [Pseudomonadota bacterium]
MTTFWAILAILRFQAVWLVFVIGAANGLWLPGVVGAAGLIAIQCAYSPNIGRELAFFLVTILVALAAELAFSGFQSITYAAHWPDGYFAPVWIFGLWLAFATAIPATRFLLVSNATLKSVPLGLVFGPLAYYGAARYGAITILEPFWISLAIVGIVWALAFPALIATHAALFPPVAEQAEQASD